MRATLSCPPLFAMTMTRRNDPTLSTSTSYLQGVMHQRQPDIKKGTLGFPAKAANTVCVHTAVALLPSCVHVVSVLRTNHLSTYVHQYKCSTTEQRPPPDNAEPFCRSLCCSTYDVEYERCNQVPRLRSRRESNQHTVALLSKYPRARLKQQTSPLGRKRRVPLLEDVLGLGVVLGTNNSIYFGCFHSCRSPARHWLSERWPRAMA